MNLNYFIAKRLIGYRNHKNKISSPIIKIAIISISIGVIIMLVAMATGFGLQHKIREKISAFSGHILINNYDSNQSDITLTPISIHQFFYPNFDTIAGIKNIQAYATIGGIIRTEKDFEGFVYKGVDQQYNWSLFKPYLIAGKIPDYGLLKYNDSVIISKMMSDRLNLKLNDRFDAFFIHEKSNKPQRRVFKIAGIYDSGFEDFDKAYILGDLHMVQKLYKWKDTLVGGFEIILNNFNQIDQKTDEIYHTIPPELNTQSIKDKFPLIFNWLEMFDFNILLILVIIIFIAGLNMITTLLVIILEKRQFIAMMKVLGANNKKLQHIFILQAAFIIAIGLLVGNVLGLGLIYLQKYTGFITLDPETYYVRTAPVYLNFKHVLLLNAGVMLAIVLMLLLPVLVVSKISPVKVLKYE